MGRWIKGRRENPVFPQNPDITWIGEEFRKRNIPPPGEKDLRKLADRSRSPEDLVERVYQSLHRRAVLSALLSFGISPLTVSPELPPRIVDRMERGVIDLSKDEIRKKVKDLLSDMVVERLSGESELLPLYRILTAPPVSLFVLSWSDISFPVTGTPAAVRKHLVTGLGRLMEERTGGFSISTVEEIFRRGAFEDRMEKKLIRAAQRAHKDQERAQKDWIRSLQAGGEVRRILGLRPAEFTDWVADGRIPVALRIEFRKWGQVLQQPLFDPAVIGAFTQEMVQAWREEREQKKKEKRRKKPEPPRNPEKKHGEPGG